MVITLACLMVVLTGMKAAAGVLVPVAYAFFLAVLSFPLLRWLVSKPVAGSLLLGGSKVTHLESNIAAIGRGPLDASTVEECDLVGAALRGPMPNYNR